MSSSVVLSCPGCATRFSAPISQFVPDGRQVRCSQCRHVWFHALPDGDLPDGDLPDAEAAAESSTGAAPMRPAAAAAVPEPESRPAPPASEPDPPARRGGGWLGPLLWGLALLLLLAILAYAFRDPLRAAVPGAAPWLDRYAGAVDRTAHGVLGGGAGAGPLEFRDVHFDVKARDGGEEMLVEADLLNTGPDALPAPRVRVRVVDAARASLHVSVIGPEDLSEEIPPGASLRYFLRIPEPPADFASVLVDIARQ